MRICIVMLCIGFGLLNFNHIACSQEKRLKAIVVGASTGIGREVAKVLAKNGYEVGVCSRKIDLLKTLQEEIPTKTYTQKIDLMKIDTVQRKLQKLVTQMGGLDLMIVNSGVWPEGEEKFSLENKKISFDGIHETIQVNVTGCAAAFNFAANYFLQQNNGHIVGISSLDAVRGTSLAPAYCASKAFMTRFLEGLRNKFIQFNIPIDVTEIRPGCIQTQNPTEDNNYTYWTISAEEAAPDIYDCITAKNKIAYVPRRWQLIAWLLMITPDWVYNGVGGF